MYLEKLEINGFKSFAKRSDLGFKPGITCVVGPNGSGKSNVADAIRWVLGEQSIKLLRGKKSEDVIFSGSDKKSRAGMAEVSLFLNNEDGIADIEYSEVVITRRLYRSGESEYLLNKQKARLQDITMLLAKSNFGQKTYSIIGQGMIDAFLLASAAERKEFFEEAAGVKSFQIKREQALSKLDGTEENLATAQIQMNEIEPRLKSLTRYVKKLEKRGALEKELQEVQWKYYSHMWVELKTKLKHESDKIKVLNEKRGGLDKDLVGVQGKIAALTKDKKESEKATGLRVEYQKVLEEKSSLREKQAGLKIKRIENMQRVQLISNIKGARSIPSVLVDEIASDLDRILGLHKKLADQVLSVDDLHKIKGELERLSGELEALFKKIKPYMAEGEDEKVEREEQNREMQEKIRKQEEEQKRRDKEIAELEEQIKDLDEKAKQIQRALQDEEAKDQDERKEIWKLQSFYQEVQDGLNQVIGQVSDSRVEIARLETRKDDVMQEMRQDLDEEVRAEIEDMAVGSPQSETGQHPVSTELDEHEKRELVTRMGNLKHQLDIIGGIDPEVEREYTETQERWDFLHKEIEDLRKAMKSLEDLVKELNGIIKEQFKKSFKIIDDEFQKYFKALFSGGKARLVLIKQQGTENTKTRKHENMELEEKGGEIEDGGNLGDFDGVEGKEHEVDKIRKRLEIDEYAGVDIEATPPGKKLKSINMLSGGERAMTSIALICSIISANPSPFVVLDEVDAALDEANSIRYAEIVNELSSKSQFIVITHNRATMEKADVLYGVTMGDDGVSKLLGLKLEDAREYTNR